MIVRNIVSMHGLKKCIVNRLEITIELALISLLKDPEAVFDTLYIECRSKVYHNGQASSLGRPGGRVELARSEHDYTNRHTAR